MSNLNNPVKSNAYTLASTAKNRPLFSVFESFFLLLGIVLAFFLSQLLGIYIAGKWLLPVTKKSSVADIFLLGSSNGTIVSLSILFSLMVLTLIIIAIIHLKGAEFSDYLALKRFSIATAVGTFGLLLIFMIASEALTYVLDKTPLMFVDPLYESVNSVWLLMVALVIAAPIYEELIFRGLLWTAIEEQFSGLSQTRGAVVASLITSFIFAVIHLQYGIYEISTIVVLALLFSYARYKSGSLLLPIALHMINNGLAMWQYLWQVG